MITKEQIISYKEKGIIFPLGPVFNDCEIKNIKNSLDELLELLNKNESPREIREWHEESRFLYEICMNNIILNCVQKIIGNNFYLWGSNFFIKYPKTKNEIAFHQDAFYWPLEPQKTVTVWLAIDDADDKNGAMTVLPCSHKYLLKHERTKNEKSELGLSINKNNVKKYKKKSVNLKAGYFSIHNDKLIHGSNSNSSDGIRTGFAIRYSPTIVKNDLKINPYFKSYMCRGFDKYRKNPIGKIPTNNFGRLYRMHSSRDEYLD